MWTSTTNTSANSTPHLNLSLNNKNQHTSLTPSLKTIALKPKESNSKIVITSCMRGTPLGRNLVPILNLNHFKRDGQVSKKLNYN